MKRSVGLVCAALVIGTALISSPAGSTGTRPDIARPSLPLPRNLSWLALGDSYSSGEGLAETSAANGFGVGDCARGFGPPLSKGRTWSRVAVDELRANGLTIDYRLAACSGAVVQQVTKQIAEGTAGNAAAGGRTAKEAFDVVSFTFGGNNVKFADLIYDCMGLDMNTHGTVGGIVGPICDVSPTEIGRRITRMMGGRFGTTNSPYNNLLRSTAQIVRPGGLLVVAGYPRPVEKVKNWPALRQMWSMCGPIHSEDVDYLRTDIVDRLNTAIRRKVDEARPILRRRYGIGIEFVDTAGAVWETPDERHGLCAKNREYLNGIIWLDLPNSFHPNKHGYNAWGEVVGSEVASYFRRHPVPTPTTTTTTTTQPVTSTTLVTPDRPLTPAEAELAIESVDGPYGKWVAEMSTYDADAQVSIVIADTPGATTSSPQQVFAFHLGRYLGASKGGPFYGLSILSFSDNDVTLLSTGDTNSEPWNMVVHHLHWADGKVVHTTEIVDD